MIDCKICGKTFIVEDFEKELLRKMEFPLPEFCPDDRLKIRLARRNERKLYKDVCDLSGKPMVSVYSPDKPYKVYSQESWWSDKWDPRDYGKDFDFSRPFFDQFYDLQLAVPRLGLMNTKAENSEYCNMTTSNRNCYLVFGGDYNEDCMYSGFCMHSKDSMDMYWTDECELCYELIDCNKCYDCKYMQNCYNCRESFFLFECRGCSNCAFCIGLINKQYHIYNKAYSPEEYAQKIKKIDFKNYQELKKLKEEFLKYTLKFPHRYAAIVNSENSTGDHLVETKNCLNCFDITGPAQDLKDVFLGGWGVKDLYSCNHTGYDVEQCYEISSSIEGYNCAFCFASWGSSYIYYSDMIVNGSKHLFGCSNMKKSEYCIFNKQYTEAAYFEMKDRIIKHMKATEEWGKFFPMKFSPFAYNETIANDLYPMSKEEVLAQGLKWLEEEKRDIPANNDISDDITDVGDNILNKTLICEKTGRPYKINESELKFYRRLNIPIPKYAPETRNEIRIEKRNPIKNWQRKCDKCGIEILSSYSPSRPEIIYCEKCYLENVY